MLSIIIHIITFVVVLIGGFHILDIYRDNFKRLTIGLMVMLIILFVGTFVGDKVDDYEKHYSVSAMDSAITVTAYHFSDDELIYDNNTGIIYIHSNYATIPYLSENGNYCRYVDGEIVEIIGG